MAKIKRNNNRSINTAKSKKTQKAPSVFPAYKPWRSDLGPPLQPGPFESKPLPNGVPFQSGTFTPPGRPFQPAPVAPMPQMQTPMRNVYADFLANSQTQYSGEWSPQPGPLRYFAVEPRPGYKYVYNSQTGERREIPILQSDYIGSMDQKQTITQPNTPPAQLESRPLPNGVPSPTTPETPTQPPVPSYNGISFKDYGAGLWQNMSPEQRRDWEWKSGYPAWVAKTPAFPNKDSINHLMEIPSVGQKPAEPKPVPIKPTW